jgi:PAS domain S-box-containing protein
MAVGSLGDPLLVAIQSSPLAMCVTDPRLPDNPMIACNRAFTELTGYQEAEVIGLNCRFLSRMPSRSEISAQISRAIQERRGVLFEVINYRKDGSSFRNAVMVAPMFDDAGDLTYMLGSQVELADARPGRSAGETRRAAARQLIATLSPRRREILGMIAKGQLNKQIAHDLGLSEKTVKMHRALLLESLKVGTTADAVRLAVEAGL